METTFNHVKSPGESTELSLLVSPVSKASPKLMECQLCTMESQSSNQSEAMVPHRPSQIFMPEVNSTARAEQRAKLLEKLNSRQEFLGLIDHHSEASQPSNQSELLEQLKVVIQQVETLKEQIETLKEQNGQTNEDVLKKLETIDASTDLWMTVCREERYDEWRKSNLEDRLQHAILTNTELRKAKRELEEKIKAIAREDAEVVAKQSANSKTTGGHFSHLTEGSEIDSSETVRM